MTLFDWKYALVLLFGVFISAVSQVLLKKSALKQYESRIREYLNFPVIAAYSIFVIATLLSIVAYRGIPLSMGPLLETTSYVYVTIFGVRLFNEKINRKKIIALCCIIGGILFYSICG